VVAVEHELLSPCRRHLAGGAPSIRANDALRQSPHDALRWWRRILDPRARRAPAVAPHPRLAAHGTPWWWRLQRTLNSRAWHALVMARHVQWRWRPPVVRPGGECDGMRQAHLGMSPAVLHIQQQPMVYSLVAAVGPHRRQVSAGCTQQPGLSFCSGGAASLTSPSAPSPVTP